MAAKFEWHGARVKAQVKAEMGRRLDAAAIVVENHAKELISVEGTSKVEKVTTDAKGRKRKRTVLKYNANPSKPGEPPHVQTGQLRSSVTHERQGMIARVGSPLKKALWLEIGTETLAARPFLRRSLAECAGAIRALIGRPVDLK